MSSARPGLHSSSQRLGVMPLVLFWNFSGSSSLKSRNLLGEEQRLVGNLLNYWIDDRFFLQGRLYVLFVCKVNLKIVELNHARIQIEKRLLAGVQAFQGFLACAILSLPGYHWNTAERRFARGHNVQDCLVTSRSPHCSEELTLRS